MEVAVQIICIWGRGGNRRDMICRRIRVTGIVIKVEVVSQFTSRVSGECAQGVDEGRNDLDRFRVVARVIG